MLVFGYPVQVNNIKRTQVYGVKTFLSGDGFTNAQCELEVLGCRQCQLTQKFSDAERHRDDLESCLCVLGAHIIVPVCASNRIRVCGHDIVQDHTVLGYRVLLWWLFSGT